MLGIFEISPGFHPLITNAQCAFKYKKHIPCVTGGKKIFVSCAKEFVAERIFSANHLKNFSVW